MKRPTARPDAERPLRGRDLWIAFGCVLAAWLVALFAEQVAVGFAFRDQIAGSWEMAEARRWVTPIALASLAPFAAIAVLVARVAEARRAWIAGLAAAFGLATGLGVSTGRHMASWLVRAPFVIALAAIAGFVAWWIAPRLARLARSRPRLAALGGVIAAMLAWSADAHVLPRLYPAFHLALLAIALGCAALGALALHTDDARERSPAIVAGIAIALAAGSLAWAPFAARRLATADNLRLVLVEHAPLLGRAVTLAARFAPPPPLDDSGDATTGAQPGELPRALDWSRRDLLLVTIDALRADHVGAYGYARPTTPSLDALAAGGARFDAAYCPAPHTSYSIASLMTGKYMKPLLAMGLGDDSDTWAGMLRRYGYRTAAFYPPAVFFIDGDRFAAMRERHFDFEYVKEEFASPELRAKQVTEYLASAPKDMPLFLWVHLFEPHEPYVAHPEHPFGASDVDRYDSEIAAADDGVGAIVRAVTEARGGAPIVIATADHGEELGDHGGRYHGTTVYEEQVRVPLVVDGPGVARGVIASVAQTIDLLPTTLSALGIPRPARLRGRDLGPLLAKKTDAARDRVADLGLAFAETDDYALLARGTERLVCARRASACALYDLVQDPTEKHDISAERRDDARDLRRALARVSGEHGRLERGEGAQWPEALRRGIAGDADAAEDVAALLDDANASVRTKAAEVSFDLHAPIAAPGMRRALATGDETVKRWCALALVRMGEPAPPLAEALVKDADVAWRRRAALAFAERGERRGDPDELAAWWDSRGDLDFTRATELLAAIAKLRDRAAVPALIRSLGDVRLRPFVADALATIGDPSARAPLAATLAREAQVTAQGHEARALVALGGAAWTAPAAAKHVETRVALPRGARRVRLVALAAGAGPCVGSWNGAPLTPSADPIDTHTWELDGGSGGSGGSGNGAASAAVSLEDEAGIAALVVVPAASAP